MMFVLAMLATLVIAGCGGERDARQVVRFWAMGFEGEMVRQLIPDFERLHPDIRVEVQQLPVTAAHEKLLTAFAGDGLPDVCGLGNTWLAEFVELRAVAPLEPFLARTPSMSPDDYFRGSWDTGVIGSHVYAVPWYVETRLPFYRRDILEAAGVKQPPRTWAQWREAMAAVKRHVGPERYAILLPLNEYEPLLNLAIQQPDPLLRDDGRYGNFRSDGFRRTLAFYNDIFVQKWAPPFSNNQISNVWNEFGRGLYTFYVNGPWNIAEFRKRLPPSMEGQWGTMPLPGPDGPGASVAGGASFVVFQQAKNKDAAWKLVAYLSDPQVQVRFHTLTGNLPPRRSAWESSQALATDPYTLPFREQLERAKPAPKVPEWERIAQELRIVGEQLVAGRYTVDEAATELDRRADAILEKRRWMMDQDAAAGGSR
ncbi:sugar ABC transporter substrate-binding protein [Lysobacter sp. MMG2]|nr:sugar ABC transporter substrate-binding protein [Lysobacter sp. MMG2]